MQHCAPTVTGEIKEFTGTKRQLKTVQVFYPNFSFCV